MKEGLLIRQPDRLTDRGSARSLFYIVGVGGGGGGGGALVVIFIFVLLLFVYVFFSLFAVFA